MDEVAESIGRLSTNAKEWKPGMTYSSSSSNTAHTTSLSSSSLPYNYSAAVSTSNPPSSPSSRYSGGGSGNSNSAHTTPTSSPYKGAFRPSPPGIHSMNLNQHQHHSHLNHQNNLMESAGGTNWMAEEFVPAGMASRASSGGNNNNNHNNIGSAWQTQSTEAHMNADLGWPNHNSNAETANNNNWNAEASNLDNITTSTVAAARAPAGITQLSQKNLHSLGLPDSKWSFYRAMAIESLREMEPTDPRHKAVPASFSHSFSLDIHKQQNSSNPNSYNASTGSSSFGYPSTVFKVMSRDDGYLYCLRRLDNVKCVSRKFAAAVTDNWTNPTIPPTSKNNNPNTNSKIGRALMDHPGICRLFQCFVSQRAVFFLHSYHPGAITLQEQFLDPDPITPRSNYPHPDIIPLQEPLIWSCMTQLISAVRAVHSSHLAVRCLQPNHILCTSDEGERLRFRINCIGVIDALEFETRKPLVDLQKEDMRCLGRILLSLATRTTIRPNTDAETLQRCERFVAQNYSHQLHSLVLSLLFQSNHTANNNTEGLGRGGSNNNHLFNNTILSARSGNNYAANNIPTISEVSTIVAQYILDELDEAHVALDKAYHNLSREYDSARSLRLLLKLGFINERPEFGMDTRWSETGDCYVLKLFRDYVFHQADVNGQPMMDLGHVVTSLNKLDAADPERIVLTSRDGKSLLVVSFADVARCLEGAYSELCAHSNAATEGRPGGSLAYG